MSYTRLDLATEGFTSIPRQSHVLFDNVVHPEDVAAMLQDFFEDIEDVGPLPAFVAFLEKTDGQLGTHEVMADGAARYTLSFTPEENAVLYGEDGQVVRTFERP